MYNRYQSSIYLWRNCHSPFDPTQDSCEALVSCTYNWRVDTQCCRCIFLQLCTFFHCPKTLKKKFPLQFQFFDSRAVSEVCYTYLLYINLPVDHSILTCGKGRRVVQCRFGPSSTIWIGSSPSLMTEPTSWSQKIIFSWFKMLDWVRPSYATCPSRVKRC